MVSVILLLFHVIQMSGLCYPNTHMAGSTKCPVACQMLTYASCLNRL